MKKDVQHELSIIFKLLGSERRLAILALLRDKPCSVSEIVDQLSMEQSAVSHQLQMLREAQVVTVEKVGRSVYYQLNDSHILTLLNNAEHHVDHVLRQMSHEEAVAGKQAESQEKHQ
ncbi:metalloregulator ArsR/SmtB family transcription factor [Fructobacillus evanidus]|uniref:ArsR family (ArsR) n=1 Tax=Fructobacillus evanidus TaxID=3064281 RepID=A0ABM9MSA7_9LACO|nr:ArsR family (ArsR) [Fructobacillus sp. LMG 32999]CAK1234021.1 ArsR family (ArsR) [Fructobacillus sp. LMG 32999]CAK1236559.1 ArsR family (ArsR) [Fructobacillus sp. LMG 32999]CAK1236750.1 ArsR family (ArsR) [Fructobacillus sp. LMG 32999]CAK1237003.1 ArsR family (ArsR) [Fructobacillus sp. LMG 32999]